MSGIEDVLSEVMASHDHEAPAAADLLHALKAAPVPPGRRGRARPRGGRRRPAWAVPIAAAAAVVLVIGLAVSVSHGLFGTRRSARTTHQPEAPRQFNPLIPYVSFGWLPAGESLYSGEARPTQVFLAAGTRFPEWGLNVYARMECHLTGPARGLACPHQGLDGTTERLKFTARAPGLGGHAFWTGTGLAWQYARDGWAALMWFGSAPAAHTPRQYTATMQRWAVKIAGHLRFDATTPLAFPTLFTGLPSLWRISDVYYLPDAGVLRADTYTLTTPAARYLPHIGDLGIWTNAPYIQIHPAPRGGSCTPHDPASNNTSEIINGYRVVVKRMTVGGVPGQQLCAAHAGGFWLSIIESGPHPPIDVASLFKDHMRLLGTNPAKWTSHPLN